MGWKAGDIDSSGVTLLGGDSLVCTSPPRVLPLTLAGAEARLLLEVATAAWLRPQPPEPGPSHQLRLREINIRAGIGQCQPGSE